MFEIISIRNSNYANAFVQLTALIGKNALADHVRNHTVYCILIISQAIDKKFPQKLRKSLEREKVIHIV